MLVGRVRIVAYISHFGSSFLPIDQIVPNRRCLSCVLCVVLCAIISSTNEKKDQSKIKTRSLRSATRQTKTNSQNGKRDKKHRLLKSKKQVPNLAKCFSINKKIPRLRSPAEKQNDVFSQRRAIRHESRSRTSRRRKSSYSLCMLA